MSLFKQYLESVQVIKLVDGIKPSEDIAEIVHDLDWHMIFGNSSQRDAFADFAEDKKGEYTLKNLIKDVYGKNKNILKKLDDVQTDALKAFVKKVMKKRI